MTPSRRTKPTIVPPAMPSFVPSIQRCAASQSSGIRRGATVETVPISTRNPMPIHCQPRREGKLRAVQNFSVIKKMKYVTGAIRPMMSVVSMRSLPRNRHDGPGAPHFQSGNRSAARERAFAASSSRFRGGALVRREQSSLLDAAEISSIAVWNAASFALEGLLKPLTLRTNCSAAAWTSSSDTGGSKLKRIRMFLHMVGSSLAPADRVAVRARNGASVYPKDDPHVDAVARSRIPHSADSRETVQRNRAGASRRRSRRSTAKSTRPRGSASDRDGDGVFPRHRSPGDDAPREELEEDDGEKDIEQECIVVPQREDARQQGKAQGSGHEEQQRHDGDQTHILGQCVIAAAVA